jgi:hypothetical protein
MMDTLRHSFPLHQSPIVQRQELSSLFWPKQRAQLLTKECSESPRNDSVHALSRKFLLIGDKEGAAGRCPERGLPILYNPKRFYFLSALCLTRGAKRPPLMYAKKCLNKKGEGIKSNTVFQSPYLGKLSSYTVLPFHQQILGLCSFDTSSALSLQGLDTSLDILVQLQHSSRETQLLQLYTFPDLDHLLHRHTLQSHPYPNLKLSSNHYPNLHRRGPSAGSGANVGNKYRPDAKAAAFDGQSSSSSGFVRGAAPHALDMMGAHSEEDSYFDEEERELSKRNTTLEGDDDYAEIYGHYATPAVPPIPPQTSYYHQQSRRHEQLQRNESSTNQSNTTSSSRWGNWWSSKSELNDSQSEFKSRHTPAAASISRRTLPLSSPAATRFGWMPRTWATRLFLLVTLAEAAADVSIESVLLSRFRDLQGTITDGEGNLSALPVFVMVFGMAHVYQCFLAVDSVVNRNTILVFGLIVFNAAL